MKNRASTETRTRIVGFKVQSADHYTIEAFSYSLLRFSNKIWVLHPMHRDPHHRYFMIVVSSSDHNGDSNSHHVRFTASGIPKSLPRFLRLRNPIKYMFKDYILARYYKLLKCQVIKNRSKKKGKRVEAHKTHNRTWNL